MSTQQRQERPEHTRSKSGFSFRSHRSSGSGDKIKLDLTETEKERRKQKFSEKSFANPNRAVQEAEPGMKDRIWELVKRAILTSHDSRSSPGRPNTFLA